MTTLLSIRDLCITFDSGGGLRGVSLDMPESGRLAVLGPSGGGKTTLLRCIAGLEAPDQGEVRIRGRVASRPNWLLPPHERGLGFVFQSPALWPHMTVARNVGFGLHGLSRSEARRRLEQVLADVGLEALAGRYPHQLSGGEARLAALARALAPRPSCLLLDEPLVNLHPSLKAAMLGRIDELARRTGAGLVYVTHDQAEAAFLAETAVFLEDGVVRGTGPVPGPGEAW